MVCKLCCDLVIKNAALYGLLRLAATMFYLFTLDQTDQGHHPLPSFNLYTAGLSGFFVICTEEGTCMGAETFTLSIWLV